MGEKLSGSKQNAKQPDITTEISRRDFLKFGVAAATGLFATVIPAWAKPVKARGGEAPASAELLQPAFPLVDLPLVDGEPPIVGEVVLPPGGILKLTSPMNSRNIPSATKASGSVPTLRQVGTLMEVDPEKKEIPGTDGDTNIWNGGTLLFNPSTGEYSSPKEGEVIYVADIGNDTFVDDPDSLPEEIQDFYRTAAELPQSTNTVTATTLSGMYDFENVGGPQGTSLPERVDNAWGITGSEDNPGVDLESPLGQLMTRLTVAAIQAHGSEESESERNFYPDVLSKRKESITVYGETKEGGTPKEKESRLILRANIAGVDRFLIVDARTQGQTIGSGPAAYEDIQAEITRVGLTTPEGLVEAFGMEKAQEIAEGVTEIQDADELIPQLGGFAKEHGLVGVFLAGLPNGPQFVPEINTKQGEVVRYERGEEFYTATIQGKDDEVLSTFVPFTNKEGRTSWLETYENVDDLPADALKIIEGQKVQFNEAYELGKAEPTQELKLMKGADGQPFMVVVGSFPDGNPKYADLYSDIPLAVTTEDENGETVWSRATLDAMLQKTGVSAGVNIDKDYALSQPFTGPLSQNFSNITISQGDFLWKWAEATPGTYESWGTQDITKLIKKAQALGGKEITAQHLFFPEQFPDWLKEGSFNRLPGESESDAYLRIMRERIEHMAEYAGSISRWTVVNEPFFDGATIGENWVRDDDLYRKLGSEYMLAAFQMAREVLGPDATLIYNDTENQSLRGRKNGLYGELTVENLRKLQGLVDVAGMQMHLDGSTPPTQTELIQAMQTYARYTTQGVEITEMDVDLSNVPQTDRFLRQAQIYQDVVDAALKAGVVGGISFWDLGDSNSWLERYMGKPDADATLFTSKLQPKPAYFAVLKAALQGVSQNN